MQVTVYPSELNGELHAPPSKSVGQRIAAAAFVKKGNTIVKQFGNSNDEKTALNILEHLGATITQNDATITIAIPEVLPNEVTIFCDESGLSSRMFTPILALYFSKSEVHAAGSLLQRKMDVLPHLLQQLGVNIQYPTTSFFPFYIEKKTIHSFIISIDGSTSSQYLTGLLIAFSGLALEESVVIQVNNLVSKPYIDLTLDVITQFDLNIPEQINDTHFQFNPYNPTPKLVNIAVEGDWSNAAFLMVAAAISGQLKLTGLDVFTKQGDKQILAALMDAKVRLSIMAERIMIAQQGALHAFQFDATDCPDLFPPLVALAAYCNGKSVINGVHRLRNKESDRMNTLIAAFDALSIEITIQDDLMIIEGGAIIPKHTIQAPNDHRIVMAIAVAALGATTPVVIQNATAVNKSYPDFFKHLSQIGAQIEIQ